MAYKRGDILLVPFPFSDLSTAKVRPALVVSSAIYHRTMPDLLLAALTSNMSALSSSSRSLDYALKEWQSANLKFATAFKPVVFTLDPARVVHKIGAIDKLDLAEIDKRLKAALGL